MRRLYLLRHAKSSWELAGELDFERGLLPRGREDLALIREYIQANEIAPDFVLCSSARRTRETLTELATALPDGIETDFSDDVYDASNEKLLELLREIKADAEAVLLIGHNPATHDLAVDLAASGDDLERMAVKFPTSALAELSFDGDWADLVSDGARIDAFVTPKELR